MNNTTTPNSTLFLDAFTDIEHKLKEICHEQYHMGFLELIRKAQSFNKVVRKFSTDLKEFAELRNAIIHTRRENFVIAEPHDDIVNEIGRIRDLLYDPPRVNLLTTVKLFVVSPSTPIIEVLNGIAQRNIMHIPVIENNSLRYLLTAKTLARWMAGNIHETDTLRKAFVADVIPYIEKQDYAVVNNQTDLFEVVELFRNTLKGGMHLQAIIITHDGRPVMPLLGIITASDLPKILGLTGSK